MTETIRINAGKGYDVKIGPGLLQKREIWRRRRCGEKSRTFARFGCRHADIVEESLRQAGFKHCRFDTFPLGERVRNMRTAAAFMRIYVGTSSDQKDAVITLGGGVAGDMGSFAASIYMRGIDFIQIPTTPSGG